MSSAATQTRTRTVPAGGDYGYANARIRGMRSRLMDRAFFDMLISAPDVKSLVKDLAETEYGPDLEEALIHGIDAGTVDVALKNNMVRTFQKVLSFLNEEALFLVTTLLGRWDLFNVKTIIRAKHMKLDFDELKEGLLPAGELGVIDLEALAIAEDVRAVVDTAVTWGLPIAVPLREGYAEYKKTGELVSLELALDRYYTQWAAERLSKKRPNTKLARQVLAMQIDITNLVMVLRLQKEDVEEIEVTEFFLPGGSSVDLDLYERLAQMSDIDEVLDKMRGTRYGKTLDEAATLYLEQNTIAVFERALEDLLTRRTLGLAKGDPLGVGVSIAYLWAKQNEITNLRIIVKGKAVGMPTERVREELILV